MLEIELDGRKLQVPEGCMVMHAAEKAGTYIPHFCYHKKLSIAANCRMCLVEVEKAPKPLPACATPVTAGMVVRTRSAKAIQAQQSVMEFLLINHPLDCPICDQGGECQLQDLAVGYGGPASRYREEKRVVPAKDVGPLVAMEEMNRCIHCTRCVRFGQEVAGVMELGMVARGEHSEICAVSGSTVDSELSGNMIDICPVGALTSKPFRYRARGWELARRRSVSPHDSTGANLIVQVKEHKVLRVLPFENEAVNECWLADRDRFSYEALASAERLTRPMLKQGGVWQETDWQSALEYLANGLQQIRSTHGAASIGALVSPHSTVEELYLTAALLRGLGSDNIDYRLRNAEFARPAGIRWLGLPIAALSTLERVLVVGSNLRKDHPLFAQRIRQATRQGCQVSALDSAARDWALPVQQLIVRAAAQWPQALGAIAAALASEQGIAPPPGASPLAGIDAAARAIARTLLTGERKAVLLGNAAAHHAQASRLLALANWIGAQTGAAVGYLTEAANTVGAQFAGAWPVDGGLHAGQMLRAGALQAVLLLNTEPVYDSAAGAGAAQALAAAGMVVTLSPFKANLEFSDLLLPIAPFSETPGSFINAEGRVQSFHAVVRPLGEARPAWKVLRVLANMLQLPGFDFDSAQQVLERATNAPAGSLTQVPAQQLSNAVGAPAPDADAASSSDAAAADPVVASIYQLDSLVRRAPALQRTADARLARDQQAQGQAQGEAA